MAAAGVDAGYIAQAYSVPEPTITSLLDAPTAEHVRALLAKIEEKAREFEEAQAEKLRTDVELETAVRNGNARAKQLKDSVEKGLKEVEELRKKLAAEGMHAHLHDLPIHEEQLTNDYTETARANVESELQNLKSSSSTSSSQVEAFQSRITSLESANRDALALLESKSTAYDKLAEELSTQQQKIVALRKEVSELEGKVQTAENVSMQFKFREQRLTEEVELLKKRDEWHEEELKRRTGEHTKYRKERTAQVAELQRNVDDVTQSNNTLKANETQLRNRLEEVNRKLEDAFVQIQSKDEEAVRRENSSRAERDNALRLAELQKKSADTARARQQELERALDQLKEDAAAEIGNLQADVNAERKDKEAAEQRVQELEQRIEELATELSAAPAAPATPRRSVNGVGSRNTPGRPGSPFTPGGASRLKAGMTMTQLVGEYTTLKAEYEKEHRAANELRQEMDGMISALENKQPEIEEANMDRERLQAEVEELSALLEQSQGDRDAARKAARKWESSSHGFQKEGDLLRQQLRDFGVQIKLLLVELQARQEGVAPLTAEQQAQFEALARGDLQEADFEGQSEISRFITERLVAFRTVAELQEQNQQLLHLVRKLGEEMEGEEAKAKAHQQEQDRQELEELRNTVAEYKDSIQSLTTRSESYIRERDMFRRMLSHRGQLPQGMDASAMFGQSLDGSLMPGTPSRAQSTEPSADSRALSDHIKLLKELQQHFDAYREEASTDQAALKRQNDSLSREKSDLQGENARLMSKEAVAQERYSLLQSNFTMLKNENTELQKRSQVLSENAAKQDLKTQQVAEDLVEARALAESMRNETANLKAEKGLWKRVETRLTEDNQSLLEERSRLNKMVSDLQSLQNERELADSETRRRLQTRVETLESELSSATRKLDEEVEQSKKAALRREYETEQNRQRIDDLLKSSANYKEELVAVKTQRDQLQARVDELKIELRNAEEKTLALQPRLTSRPTPGAQVPETDENALSREQELAIEVADLKRDLELKEAELQSVKDEIEQYKSIAQTAEEELQQMNDTSDQYRQETDAAITEKDAKIQELQTRVNEISSELASTNTELSELRSKQDESTSKFNDQKAIYESELARLRDESDRLAETARLHQEDLKAQAEIAQQAQQNYEDELVKHAEAASGLQKLRGEHNTLKTEVAGFKAEAEAAKLSLLQSEESWTETRAKYEQEITEIKNSREELKTQNHRLHTQLEDLSTQIENLKKSRAAVASNDEDANATPDPTSNNLQDIIRYLRQEKEIIDMQYELQIQESKRLQQQLTYANTQLDDVREKLEAERRSNTSASEQATSHSKLMQTINELNLFRESNSSLRNEARSAQEQLAKKIKEVDELVAQLEPLKTKAREAEYELEAKQGEIKLLQEDRDRWQKRTQDIMQKYDRVDPAELQDLRNQITQLSEERDAAANEKAPLQAQLDEAETKHRQELEEKEKGFQERRQKIIDQSKERDKKRREEIAEKIKEVEAAAVEQQRLTEELAAVKSELEEAKKARDEAVAQAKASAESGEEGQIKESDGGGVSEGERAILESQVAAAEERASSEASRAAALEEQVGVLNGRIETLKGQVVSLQSNILRAAITLTRYNRLSLRRTWLLLMPRSKLRRLLRTKPPQARQKSLSVCRETLLLHRRNSSGSSLPKRRLQVWTRPRRNKSRLPWPSFDNSSRLSTKTSFAREMNSLLLEQIR
jgi:nucleoprotein TPR